MFVCLWGEGGLVAWKVLLTGLGLLCAEILTNVSCQMECVCVPASFRQVW